MGWFYCRAQLREALNGGFILLLMRSAIKPAHAVMYVPVMLRNVDNTSECCGFPANQLSCICSEGSTDLQP